MPIGAEYGLFPPGKSFKHPFAAAGGGDVRDSRATSEQPRAAGLQQSTGPARRPL